MASAMSDELISVLAARLAAEPDIAVAYLFGSRARGNARPNSDVDVAVLLDDGVDTHSRQLDLMATLGANVDLVILNDARHRLWATGYCGMASSWSATTIGRE